MHSTAIRGAYQANLDFNTTVKAGFASTVDASAGNVSAADSPAWLGRVVRPKYNPDVEQAVQAAVAATNAARDVRETTRRARELISKEATAKKSVVEKQVIEDRMIEAEARQELDNEHWLASKTKAVDPHSLLSATEPAG